MLNVVTHAPTCCITPSKKPRIVYIAMLTERACTTAMAALLQRQTRKTGLRPQLSLIAANTSAPSAWPTLFSIIECSTSTAREHTKSNCNQTTARRAPRESTPSQTATKQQLHEHRARAHQVKLQPNNGFIMWIYGGSEYCAFIQHMSERPLKFNTMCDYDHCIT